MRFSSWQITLAEEGASLVLNKMFLRSFHLHQSELMSQMPKSIHAYADHVAIDDPQSRFLKSKLVVGEKQQLHLYYINYLKKQGIKLDCFQP